jgi:hypothetical protein
MPSLLIVDPDWHVTDALALEARKCRDGVTTYSSFEKAYEEIRMRRPRMVVAHAVIGKSQGVHLAQAALRANPLARSVIYGGVTELVLARTSFNRCVFFERQTFVRHSLPRYLTADLPGVDRREVRVVDRRTTFRGGRRASDIEALRAPRPAGVAARPAASSKALLLDTPPSAGGPSVRSEL